MNSLSRHLPVVPAALFLVVVWLVGGGRVAFANGNYSHLWAANDALAQLDDGDLKELLSRPELLQMLQNGANFPDGGYAIGDGYGEIAHWEPFLLAYLEWIRATYTQPWSDEASQHIAFLMGIAAHGTSDQLYDGMFLERHEYYDAGGGDVPILGLDGATDACFAAVQGPISIPATWVPAAELAPIFDAAAGHQVEPKTIQNGQKLVVIAIMASNDAVNNPDKITEYASVYPYACGQQNNSEIPGTIPTHGAVIAQYWGVLWERLNGGDPWDRPFTGTFYTGAQPYEQELDAANPDSWVSFAMPFGLDAGSVNTDTVVVTSADGTKHPVMVDVYYGENSHLVNVMPVEDWKEDSDYTVTVLPPIASSDGHVTTIERSFAFSTKPRPVEPGGDDVGADDLHDGSDVVSDLSGTEDGLFQDSTVASDLSSGDLPTGLDTLNGDQAGADGGGDGGAVTGGGSGNGGGCSGSVSENSPHQLLPWLMLVLVFLPVSRRFVKAIPVRHSLQ